MPHRVLLVEDDPAVRQSVGASLRDEGFEVYDSGRAEDALANLKVIQPDIVLSDLRMPGMDGLELLGVLRDRAPTVDVVLMTAYDDMPTVAQAMRGGAFDFLVKPVKRQELRSVFQRVAEDRQRDENRNALGRTWRKRICSSRARTRTGPDRQDGRGRVLSLPLID